jgi:hypothetical protein
MTARIGEELVMMSVEKGNYVGLSDVGRRIWELIKTPQDIEAICAQLLEEFDVAPAACKADVETFLKVLERHGAIALDPDSP